MSYRKIEEELKAQGYDLVAKDDRLLDVLPTQIREKGVELWEKWESDIVHITRIHEPQNVKSVTEYTIARKKIERALLGSEIIDLDQTAQ